MARRSRLSKRRSRRMFRKGASRIHKRNIPSVMRGGYRL